MSVTRIAACVKVSILTVLSAGPSVASAQSFPHPHVKFTPPSTAQLRPQLPNPGIPHTFPQVLKRPQTTAQVQQLRHPGPGPISSTGDYVRRVAAAHDPSWQTPQQYMRNEVLRNPTLRGPSDGVIVLANGTQVLSNVAHGRNPNAPPQESYSEVQNAIRPHVSTLGSTPLWMQRQNPQNNPRADVIGAIGQPISGDQQSRNQNQQGEVGFQNQGNNQLQNEGGYVPQNLDGYVPQDQDNGGPSEEFNQRIGIWYVPIRYSNDTWGVKLTRFPAIGSPAAQAQLEPGDTIVALDGQSLLGKDDLDQHYDDTVVDLIDVRTNRWRQIHAQLPPTQESTQEGLGGFLLVPPLAP